MPPTFADVARRGKPVHVAQRRITRYDGSLALARSLRLRVVVLAWPLALLAAQAAGCAEDGATGGSDDEGPGQGATRPEAGVGGSEDDRPSSIMRLAHLADGVDEIDFCYRPSGTGSFEGPVLARGTSPERDGGPDADAGDDAGEALDADADGGDAEAGSPTTAPIAPRTVSRYLVLPAAGPLTLAVVRGGASSCANPLATGDVTLDPGKLTTVVVLGTREGEGATALGVTAFVDDRRTEPDKARVRLVNAALGDGTRAPSALAVRAVAGTTTVLADRIEPRKKGAASMTIPVDELGYATVAPVPPPTTLAIGPAADTSADAAPEPWQSAATDLELVGGSLHTGFVVSEGTAFAVLWCADTRTAGDRTACSLVR